MKQIQEIDLLSQLHELEKIEPKFDKTFKAIGAILSIFTFFVVFILFYEYFFERQQYLRGKYFATFVEDYCKNSIIRQGSLTVLKLDEYMLLFDGCIPSLHNKNNNLIFISTRKSMIGLIQNKKIRKSLNHEILSRKG